MCQTKKRQIHEQTDGILLAKPPFFTNVTKITPVLPGRAGRKSRRAGNFYRRRAAPHNSLRLD
jgi:hypothetical protein